MSDLISRQAALEAIQARADMELADINHNYLMGLQEAAEAVESVPDAQPGLDEWCTDCKEYDHEKHHCPRWNRVIREALKDAQPEERTEERTEMHACDSISRQAAIDIADDLRDCISVDGYWAWMERLKKLPAADAVPVVHGEWIDNNNIWMCNKCGKWIDILQGDADMNYCPNCGADMRGEQDG